METGPSSALESAASSVVQQGQKKQIPPELLALLSGQGGGLETILKSGGTTMAPSTTNPQPPVKYNNTQATGDFIPQGDFQSSGEAKRAATGAAMHSMANIARNATDYIHQKKMRAMSMDVERVLSAMDGLKEAKASGNKEAEQHNQQIINDMFSDPKKVKMFEKAFNIPLVGEHKNKNTPEYQGLISAVRKWQSDKSQGKSEGMNPLAQKFMDAQPARQQVDPRLAAQAAAVKAGILPSADAQVKARTEIATAVEKSLDEENKTEGRIKVADILAAAKDNQTKTSILKQVLANQGREGAMEVMGRYRLASVAKQGQNMINNTMWQMAGRLLVSEENNKSASKEVTNLAKMHRSINDQIKNLTKDIDDKSKAEHWFMPKSDELKKSMDTLKGLQQKQKDIVEKMDSLELKDTNASGTDGTGDGTSKQDGVDQVIERIFNGSDDDEDESQN